MSIVSALAISLSGIRASSARLEIASDNIANASVDGFTKKTATLTSATLGSAGSGVVVSGFRRATNGALFNTLSAAITDAGKLGIQHEYLQKTLDILGTSSSDEPALSVVMTGFVNAWTQLSAEPESSVSQQQVIQASDNLANEIQRLASGVEGLDRECKADIESTIGDLNNYLIQVQDLNSKVSMMQTSKMSSAGLEDDRDQIILKISKTLDVKILQRNNGQIAVYTKSGYQLVDGASVCNFSYDGDDIYEEGNLTFSMNGSLVGGSIEGLVNFRAETLPVSTNSGTSIIQKLRSQLDEIVDSLTSLVTTATSGEATFAAAYNNAAVGTDAVASHYLLTDAMRLTAATAGAAGNSIDYTIDTGTNVGTHKITITDGVTTEVIDNVDLGAGPYDWTAMVNAITALPSTLVTAATNGTAALDPGTLTLPLVNTLYGGTDAAAREELASDFFTGTDRTNIAVNAALLNGTSTIKLASAGVAVDALLDSTRVFTADGLNASGASHRSTVTSIMASFQQDAKNVSSLNDTALGQKDYLKEKLDNETGVNTDEEMVNLIILQQAYTASARVMTVANDLFTVLTNIV